MATLAGMFCCPARADEPSAQEVDVLKNALGNPAAESDPAVAKALKDLNLPADFLTVPKASVSGWDEVFSLRTGAGYKDNVALSSFHPEASPYLLTGLDASAYRIMDNGSQLFFMLSGDDTRYFSSPGFDHEDLWQGVARWKTSFGSGWKPQMTLQYTYQDMVLDAGTAVGNGGAFSSAPTRAQGHLFRFAPELRRDLGSNYWAAVEFMAGRRMYAAPFHSYWEFGPRLSVGVKSENFPSELILGYGVSQVLYDSENLFDRQGNRVPGTVAQVWANIVDLQLKQYLDHARHWSLSTKLRYEHDTDNGSGFLDYSSYGLAEELTFKAKGWTLRAQGLYYFYDFPFEPTVNSSSRYLHSLTAIFRCEKMLGKHWKIFAEYQKDLSYSNDATDQYQANNVNAGIELEF